MSVLVTDRAELEMDVKLYPPLIVNIVLFWDQIGKTYLEHSDDLATS